MRRPRGLAFRRVAPFGVLAVVSAAAALAIDAEALKEMGVERDDLHGEDVPASIDTESGQLLTELKEN